MLRAQQTASLAHLASIVQVVDNLSLACVIKAMSVPVVNQQRLPRVHSTLPLMMILNQAHAQSATIVPLVQVIQSLVKKELSIATLAHPSVLLVLRAHIVLQSDLLL